MPRMAGVFCAVAGMSSGSGAGGLRPIESVTKVSTLGDRSSSDDREMRRDRASPNFLVGVPVASVGFLLFMSGESARLPSISNFQYH